MKMPMLEYLGTNANAWDMLMMVCLSFELKNFVIDGRKIEKEF